MIIRQASLDAFKQVAIVSFEDEMIERCKGSSPTICRSLTKEQLRLAIRNGMQGAKLLGFTRRGSVQFYLDCSLSFGSGFATDPQYPWIAEVLARDDFEQELHKSEALYEKVKTYLDHVAGTDSRYVRGCLRRLLRMFNADLPVRAESFEYDMVQIFEELHPEKNQAAGPVAIETVLRQSVDQARNEYGLSGIRSVALLAILKWFLGIRCDEDPFHPWIRETLTIHESKGTEAAGVRLEIRAMAFFEAYLQELA
jgi:hypothetical protein